MFDIGLQEFLVIGILVLLFFPPDDLPALFRQAGRLYAKVRGASDDLRRAFNAEVARVENDQRLEALRLRREAAQRARDEAAVAAGKPVAEAAPAEPEPDPAHDEAEAWVAADPRLPPDAAPRRVSPPASVGRPAPFAPPAPVDPSPRSPDLEPRIDGEA